MENIAPSGFQHLLQPHAWLNATLAPSGHRHRCAGALARERAAFEILGAGFHAVVDRRMKLDCHDVSLLVLKRTGARPARRRTLHQLRSDGRRNRIERLGDVQRLPQFVHDDIDG
jgi:hypothetical protein